MNRRKWLTLLSVLVILSFVLTACGAPAPTAAPPAEPTKAPAPAPTKAPEPTKAPAAAAPAGKYTEAPMLAELVKAGKLPPVDQRVSADPLVIKAIEEIGQYGGVWRRAWKGPADFHAYGRLNYDPILRWPRNPKDAVQPGLASKWEFSPDGKSITLFFRKGLKWSDGQPWTVDDIIFWWEDIELNTELTKAPHAEWVVNGKAMTLKKIDDATIQMNFDGPNGLVERMLAFHGNQWPLNFERFGAFAPAHYLKQFHPKYNKDIKDFKLFNEKADDLSPGRPAMTPWTVKTFKPGDAKLIAERNPYYWKVDEKGQQLPYIDQIELSLVENNDAIAAKALGCEIDMQFRNMDLRKFPLFKENEKKCDYRLFRWASASGTNLALWPNQSYAEDPVLRDIFQNKDFRIALSYAIDRKKINAIAYLDQGVIRSEMVVPDSAFYVPEVENLYTDFDPKKAAEALDKAGLKMGPDGKVRLRPDGKPLEITIETERSGTDLDALQLITENWNAVGVKTALKSMTRDAYWPRATGNQVQIAVWGTDRGLEPFVDPIYIFPFDERSWMAPAFGVWYKTGGKEGIKPTGKLAEVQGLFDQFKLTIDQKKQLDLGKQMIKTAVEEAWTIQTVGMSPVPVIVKNNFRNVPEKFTQDWIIMSPGTLEPSHFFFKK
jgi:peptide/nickel transport system substrate-binding protein